VLQLEGYQYDRTADLLTAQLVHVAPAGTMTEAVRSEVEIPICDRLRRVVDETMTILSLAASRAQRDRQAETRFCGPAGE
jgi:hypothetical protein